MHGTWGLFAGKQLKETSENNFELSQTDSRVNSINVLKYYLKIGKLIELDPY